MASWLGCKPRSHWSYSNTGYALLGMVLERLHGQTLEIVLTREAFAPLGLKDAKGAIRDVDQALYTTGYAPAMSEKPYPRGGPPTIYTFGEALDGAGCVAMPTPDMATCMRWLIQAGRGSGGPLLSDAAARQWIAPTVDAPGWSPGAKYANGLAVVNVDGRTLLHHTGGMITFSSSLHVDPQAGWAASPAPMWG